MEGGDGMVAVVRGLHNAALAVTLLDGCRRYTLMPNSVPLSPVPTQVHESREIPECLPVSPEAPTEPVPRCDFSAQAIDGRYASTYQIAHCNVTPTSPPVQLTEFPPQRVDLCPGHGNFEVGGSGSGEKYSPIRGTQFRGGLSWPDKGSVCAPRASYELDSFANSLRKYPATSPQRSSEMVERLVNYTQAKHSTRTTPRSQTSPTRLSECNSNHTFDKDSRVLSTRHRCYEPEVTIRPRMKTHESPTREGRPRRFDHCPDLSGTTFCRNYDIRCQRELPKRIGDNVKNFSTNQPCYLNPMDKHESPTQVPESVPRRSLIRTNRNSVNTETQAVVEVMSREVATLPRIEPSKRNVAIPLTPVTSGAHHGPESQLAVCPTLSALKSVQTIPMNRRSRTRKFVQATSSSIELLTVNKWHYNQRIERKSKSQEELRTRRNDFKKEILHLLENIDCRSDEMYRAFVDELIRKIKKNKRKISFGIEGRAKSSPYWFKASCRHCVNHCKKTNNLKSFRAETRNIGVPNDDSLQDIVKNWLQEMQIKNVEPLEGHTLDQIVDSLAAKLRNLCLSSEDITKSQVMQMIEEVTFDASDIDRNVQMNNLADALTKKIKDILNYSAEQLSKNKHRGKNKNSNAFTLKKFIQPTEDEVRGFVREELVLFVNKFHLKLNSRNINDVEIEVIDILIDSINELQWGDTDKVKEELIIALQETSKLPEHYVKCLADILIIRYKNFMHTLYTTNTEKEEPQTYIVLQNTFQNTSRQQNDTKDFSIEPITEADIEAHIEEYTSQLTQVIEAWWTNVLGTDENEKGFRDVAINDLAGDIVDRHRFLEMDTSKRWSTADEVEYLKYQIFRWINKLVGDDAMQQAQDRAPELMEQIQKIPVPLMKLPENATKPKNIPKERPQSPTTARSPGKPPTKNTYNVNQLPLFGTPGRDGSLLEGSKKQAASMRRMSGPASYSMSNNRKGSQILGQGRTMPRRRFSNPANGANPRENLNTRMPTLHEVNEDLDIYVRDWVNQIPMPANSPQEREQAEKLKVSLHSGVWKALIICEMNSVTIKNELYFQELFDNLLDELFSTLPSSQELMSQKDSLKAKIIERATNTIFALRNAVKFSSYKHRLWNAINFVLPRRPRVDDKDKSTAHLLEDLLKLNICEDYLLHRLYTKTNKSKSELFRQKVIISLHKLHENAMLLPGNQAINPDKDRFAFNLIHSMIQVEEPDLEVFQDEADQIILGHEIAQWLQDLPIPQSDALIDQLQRRRLRDTLAKKINEIEKQTNLCDNSAVRQLKNELSKFVGRFSPRPEEAENLSFLIDEFINRLKNRREEIQEYYDFEWFKWHVPLSSSIAENIGQGPVNNGGFNLSGSNLVPQAPHYKEPSNQVKRESQALKQGPLIPSCCQSPAAANFRPQGISPGGSELAPYREPSNVEWLTLLNTQERIQREKEALAAEQVPPCCRSGVAGSQGGYKVIGSGIVYEPVVNAGEPGLHTSQVAGPSYEPIARVPQVVVQPATSSMNSELRHFVELQDQNQSASFAQHSAQPIIQMPVTRAGISRTSQMPGPSGLSGAAPSRLSEQNIRETPLGQRSVRPRQLRAPEQILSSGSPTTQSQFEAAAPLAQREPIFEGRHDIQDMADQNISRPLLSPLNLSFQEPVGYSTPRQAPASPGRRGPHEYPGAPRARRKRTREGEEVRSGHPRRRLDFDELEEEEERERDEVQCRCTERVYRCRRRRPMCCDCEDMDYPRYYPMPYPYCFF